jgi:predicted CopG family antitoxin
MPKTVQLREDTYAALKTYKVGGMTFDDVIRRLMEEKDPEAFHEEYRAWQKGVVARMRASGEFKPL